MGRSWDSTESRPTRFTESIAAPNDTTAIVPTAWRELCPCLFAFFQAVFDALDMAASHAFDLAAQFQITPDPDVIEDAEAIDDREGPANTLENLVRIELQIRLVTHSQDDGVRAFHRRPHV